MGAGGVILPPEGYFDAITAVLDKHDIPLIDDEVITGFGRTGEWFGCGTYGFEPESMTIAKALSSAYLPISAVMLSPELSRHHRAGERKDRHLRPRLHLYRPSGGRARSRSGRSRSTSARDIVGHVRHVAPLFQKRLQRARRSSAGRRGRRRRPDRRRRTRRRQEDEEKLRSARNRSAPRWRLRAGRRPDRAAAAWRPHRASARRWSSTRRRSANCSTASNARWQRRSTGRRRRS